jgi:hypothetical protein
MEQPPQETNYTNDLSLKEIEDIEFDPQKNVEMISIVHRPDGNYRGFCMKSGTLIQARAGDPNTVLTMLITHS